VELLHMVNLCAYMAVKQRCPAGPPSLDIGQSCHSPWISAPTATLHAATFGVARKERPSAVTGADASLLLSPVSNPTAFGQSKPFAEAEPMPAFDESICGGE